MTLFLINSAKLFSRSIWLRVVGGRRLGQNRPFPTTIAHPAMLTIVLKNINLSRAEFLKTFKNIQHWMFPLLLSYL